MEAPRGARKSTAALAHLRSTRCSPRPQHSCSPPAARHPCSPPTRRRSCSLRRRGAPARRAATYRAGWRRRRCSLRSLCLQRGPHSLSRPPRSTPPASPILSSCPSPPGGGAHVVGAGPLLPRAFSCPGHRSPLGVSHAGRRMNSERRPWQATPGSCRRGAKTVAGEHRVVMLQ
jgi:hypothetical protein